MTGATSIQLLLYAFTLLTLSGLAALLWLAVRKAPVRMKARLDREIAERRAAMAALAHSHASSADGPTRVALERNFRFHRAAVRALDPMADLPELPLR